MNNTPTPTPRTDKAEFSFDTFNGVDPWEGERWIKVVPSKISAKLESELTAITEQRDEAREEIKELNDKLDDAVADATNAVNDIIRMKWQRDRLAECCDWMTPKQATPEEGEWVLHTYAGVRVPEYGMYARGVFLRNNSPESFPTTHWMRIPSIDEPNNQPTEP